MLISSRITTTGLQKKDHTKTKVDLKTQCKKEKKMVFYLYLFSVPVLVDLNG